MYRMENTKVKIFSIKKDNRSGGTVAGVRG